jgi:hypothetical protein
LSGRRTCDYRRHRQAEVEQFLDRHVLHPLAAWRRMPL